VRLGRRPADLDDLANACVRERRQKRTLHPLRQREPLLERGARHAHVPQLSEGESTRQERLGEDVVVRS
jgi:hypothetical protein